MKDKAYKKILFIVGAGVFCLHFMMTILHNVPEKYISARAESYSHLWCYPFFHQGWALFAPEPPPKTKHMDMRFARQAIWSDWYRAEDICMEEHQAYRVSYYSKLCHVTQNTAFHLWQEQDRFEQQSLDSKNYFPTAMGYGMATHFADAYAFHFLADLAYDSLEVRLVLEDPFEREEPEIVPFPVYQSSSEDE